MSMVVNGPAVPTNTRRFDQKYYNNISMVYKQKA